MGRNYNDPRYKQARSQALQRDGYCCQWPNCGSTKFLHVHHIRKWADQPSLRYVLNNLITLCRHHHNFISGNEDDYAKLFFRVLNDKRSKQQGNDRSSKVCKRNKKKKCKSRTKRTQEETYARRYAKAKYEAKRKRGRK